MEVKQAFSGLPNFPEREEIYVIKTIVYKTKIEWFEFESTSGTKSQCLNIGGDEVVDRNKHL